MNAHEHFRERRPVRSLNACAPARTRARFNSRAGYMHVERAVNVNSEQSRSSVRVVIARKHAVANPGPSPRRTKPYHHLGWSRLYLYRVRGPPRLQFADGNRGPL